MTNCGQKWSDLGPVNRLLPLDFLGFLLLVCVRVWQCPQCVVKLICFICLENWHRPTGESRLGAEGEQTRHRRQSVDMRPCSRPKPPSSQPAFLLAMANIIVPGQCSTKAKSSGWRAKNAAPSSRLLSPSAFVLRPSSFHIPPPSTCPGQTNKPTVTSARKNICAQWVISNAKVDYINRLC